MDWATVVLVGIVIWGGVKAIQAKYGIVSDEDGNETRITPDETQNNVPSKAEVAQLKERVQVLERLVTDRGYSLSHEIEALRDIPAKNADSGVPLNMNTKTKA